MPSPEMKRTIEKLGTAFDQFKASNDDRLDKLEKTGGADVLLVEKVDRINESLSKMTKLKKRLEALEKKGNRPGQTDGDKDSDRQAHKEAFLNGFVRKGHEAGLAELQKKALSVGVDSDGGFAVIEEMNKEISKRLADENPMREEAKVIMVGASDYKKLIDVGGASSGWVGETDPRADTDTPKIEQLTPFMGELYASPKATQSSLDDIFFDVEEWLTDSLVEEFSDKEGAGYTFGDGVNKPKGFLSYTMSTAKDGARTFNQIQKLASGSSGDFAADFILDLFYSLRTKYRKNAKFMMSSDTILKARKLKNTEGSYIWVPGLKEGEVDLLMGKSVSENEDMPSPAADSLSMAFADFNRAYTIVDRFDVRMLRDPFTAKPYVSFYTTKRTGGMVIDDNAIKVGQLSI